MGQDFIVIEGRNSSGKTSLAEALEWLLSGSLSRRESSHIGDTRELEHCITNVFRPTNEDTWVNAEFVSYSSESDADTFTLRRVLQEDYGATAKATCRSVLYLNDKKLSPSEERQVLDQLFAGVPPLLMQHTLSDFVQGAPERRRNYFERLLRLDEATELIRLAVISDDRANNFPSPSGGEYFRLWNQLGSTLENNQSHKIYSQRLRGHTLAIISDALSSISRIEFPALLDGMSKHEEILSALKTETDESSTELFPYSRSITPQKTVVRSPTRVRSCSDCRNNRPRDSRCLEPI